MSDVVIISEISNFKYFQTIPKQFNKRPPGILIPDNIGEMSIL